MSADSYQYIRLAYSPFGISDWDNRPFGYPLFLKVFLFNSFFGVSLILFVQAIISSLMPNIIYIAFYKKYSFAAKFLTIVFLIYPYYNFLSRQIMTDTIFIFMILICIYFTFKLFNNLNIKNILIINLIIFITASIRPSAQILFLAVPGTLIIYYIYNFKSKEILKLLIISIVLGLSSLKIYTETLPAWGKSFGGFITYYRMAAEFCEIKDSSKLNEILDKGFVWAPDNENFYMKYYSIDELDWRKADAVKWEGWNSAEDIYSEKCLKRDTSEASISYFNKVEELIKIDPFLKKQLTHYYDVKLSPTDEPHPYFVNKNNRDIVDIVHEKVINVQPFIYIYFSMARNYGFDQTNEIIKQLTRSVYFQLDNGLLMNAIKKNIISEVYGPEKFYMFLEKKQLYDNARTSFRTAADMNFWRFIIRPYKTIEEQNANYLYGVTPKIFSQSTYSIFKLISEENLIEFDKNQNKNYWEIREKYFNEITIFKDFADFMRVLKKFIIDKSISDISVTVLIILQTIIMSITSFWLLYILIPMYLLFKLLINSKKIKNFDKSKDNYAFFCLILSGAISFFMHFFLFGDQRHYMFHEPFFLLMLLILIDDLRKFLKLKN